MDMKYKEGSKKLMTRRDLITGLSAIGGVAAVSAWGARGEFDNWADRMEARPIHLDEMKEKMNVLDKPLYVSGNGEIKIWVGRDVSGDDKLTAKIVGNGANNSVEAYYSREGADESSSVDSVLMYCKSEVRFGVDFQSDGSFNLRLEDSQDKGGVKNFDYEISKTRNNNECLNMIIQVGEDEYVLASTRTTDDSRFVGVRFFGRSHFRFDAKDVEPPRTGVILRRDFLDENGNHSFTAFNTFS
jgi:hypothetical protein